LQGLSGRGGIIFCFRSPIHATGTPKGAVMIELTRLNGNPMVLNSDLIKTAEASPDTMLTLVNGEKLIVREPCSEVMERVLVYRSRLLAAVAERLKSSGGFERTAAIASLDLAGQCDILAPAEAPKSRLAI